MDKEQQYEQPSLKALKLYLSYWRYYKKPAVFGVIFSFVLALQATVIPLIIAVTLGQLVRVDEVNTALMVVAGIVAILIVIAGYFFDTRGVALLHDGVVRRLYSDCFNYLTHQDYGFFANRFSGAIVTQASRFAKSYTFFNDTIFFGLLPHLFSALIILGVMFWYSPLLALIVMVLWIIAVSMVVKFALMRLPLRRAAVAKESEQVGELADVINNALNVKTFSAEDTEMARYENINSVRAGMFLKSWFMAVRNAWIVEAVCAAMQMTVFIGGIIAVQHGTLSIATFLLFQVYIFKMIDNISRSIFIVRQIEAASGDAQEMAEMLQEPPLVRDKASPSKSLIKNGSIEFTNVDFQYQDAGHKEALFEDFSLTIKTGEKIGLVGPSGGGKTTITRLLLRFMDIQDGTIKIDGQDIREIKQQDLRRAIAYVSQEPLLFHRSIKENIQYGKPDAADDEVIEVSKKSYAHDFVSQLPQGYDTLVGERGVKLSGGQRQRIAIARAMLKDAPVLVLDEATSALDSQSEQLIQKALWELMKDKTAVVIAHRLSTIQKMDRIVVLDDGKIIEQGTHKELLKQKGLYAKLWAHQSGGFLEED